ncbi:MAG: hypothetical protein CVV64_16420 [Candidatus Wallbacteria bacterium HGW-Wallbacteria-1]|jgi:1,4-dihydroxy-2-naphthoate octaprenyltransferase|uniref:1,4-dihydroxy-2-naphthoate octaprenyltransferase n=1 Tax=Candidatus Wallbacteria bacterium HGW-Wallbacteria-1 TaxID=2013854 RepID=A0A2N1PKY5_9BACT|nr:MAG: hypothetical protein CVV64_16420 [Candidatus Wallbacteria bacterium HGW-Wallbacteria-1]
MTLSNSGMYTVKLWFRAIRAFAYPASLMPVIVTASLGKWLQLKASWALLPALIIGVTALHTATNLYNDHYDYLNGVDTADSMGSSGILVEGSLNPSQILNAGHLFLILGTIAGLVILRVRGEALILPALLGFLGALLYTCPPINYKYLGLGEVMVFLLLGPVLVYGSALTLFGVCPVAMIALSIPLGIAAAAILLGNNIRDLKHDEKCGITTLAGAIGAKRSALLYMFMLFLVPGSIIAMLALNLLPGIAVFSLLTMAASISPIRRMCRFIREKQTDTGDAAIEDLAGIDAQTAAFHLYFGLSVSIALLSGAF